MKRILIALAVLLAVQVADAQTKTPDAAKKALVSAEAASQDAKKAAKVATWTKLASAYMDAYNAPVGNAWVGASKQELQLLMGNDKPTATEEAVVEGVPYIKEIYADKEIKCSTELPARFIASMDESLATTLVTNLIKNAFLHTADGGSISIAIHQGAMTISNSGEEALDATRLFDRFYTSGKSGSTGLGLALVKSIAEFYRFKLEYNFAGGRHHFAVVFQAIGHRQYFR